MLRKILELNLGPMTDSEFREVLDLATSDIKTYRVDFVKTKNIGEYKATDRVPWFVDVKEHEGITFIHAFAVGVINAIIDDPYHTAEEMVQEIRGTLSDLKKVT